MFWTTGRVLGVLWTLVLSGVDLPVMQKSGRVPCASVPDLFSPFLLVG